MIMVRLSRLILAWLALWSVQAWGEEGVDAHEAGRKIYNFRCYYCHGYSGNARTLAATFLSPPPRDFTAAPAPIREAMEQVVTRGRPGTAMVSFATVLSPEQIRRVVAFIDEEFVRRRAENTRYHTPENGWPGHERYQSAYPFATGEIALDTPDDRLTPEQLAGKGLFLATCITCHDRARVEEEGVIWEPRPVSFPRNGFVPGETKPVTDAISAASPYVRHDQPPPLSGATESQRRGEMLYQANCAFCHAADGTGKNWIGSFLEPHPRNLTDPRFMTGMTGAQLAEVIREGLPGTSMPAWKGVLSEEEIRAIMHYIHRVFHAVDGVEGVSHDGRTP